MVLKQERELLKQEMELFLLLHIFQSINFFNKVYSILMKDSDSVLETGNRIIKKGNGFFSPTSSFPIKKTALTKFIPYCSRIQIRGV